MTLMADISILHLSDVHFGCPDQNAEQERIVEGISDAILDAQRKVDIIVFTGDLTQAARPSEFQQGEDWLTALGEKLNAKIIIVPGNHDADRSKANLSILRTAFPNPESFGLQRKEIYKSHPHLEPFMQWFKSAKSECPRFLNTWSDNPAIDTVTLSMAQRDLIFICVNTALISCCNQDEGNLCIDIAPLNSALKKLKSDSTLIVAVGHHPLKDLAAWNRQEFNKLLGQETGPHIYLHGHVHVDKSEAQYSGDGSGYFTGVAGAAYPGSTWAKSFSIIDVKCDSGVVTPSVFVFSDESGKWFIDNKKSRDVSARLPQKKVVKPSVGVGAIVARGDSHGAEDVDGHNSKNLYKFVNPFSDIMANGMDPEAVHRLFVDQSNSLQSLSNHIDTIIEGQRGTGKTMLLRYFSFEVQASLLKSEKNGKVKKSFGESRLPFGIYCCLSNAGMNRSDYDAVASKERLETLFIHRFTSFVVSRLFGSLILMARQEQLTLSATSKIQKYATRLLKLSPDLNSLTFEEYCQEILTECNFMLEEVDAHVASILPGGCPSNFSPWLSLSNSLMGLLKHVKESLGLQTPFFILIDDFDLLNADQQTSIFKTAAIRDHSLACFKFGIMSEGQKSFLAGEGRTYREGDDYHLIPLNWLDRGLNQDSAGGNYTSMVDEISKRRMERAGWKPELSFKTLFNNWEQGDKIRKDVRRMALEEYEALPKSSRPQTFESYWSKQGDAKYFRHLKSKKIEHKYAGPSTIIDLSSGIFRQFLEIGSAIVNSALASGWTPTSDTKIGPVVQNRAIRAWSKDMLRSLGSSGDVSTLSKRKFEVTSLHLVTLADSLSQFFASRLYSDSKDPEVIAISIKGDITAESFARSLLEVAVRESVLQRRSVDYSSKSGSERLPTFLLNRRLVPHVGIGTKLQGRHEIDVETLVLAATDTQRFLAKISSKVGKKNNQMDLI
ncbi:metallophosphoesterase family protein [Undibacterium macrobrachii]|uniref:Calcineurin-like phosphoesterase domain-containing protein n=1 Tax=Undibacterium macrobrachii TaxID=1119058 RepID=A0ABQ2XCZ3_9BURK|nr:metallophosphoesterase [Undibacterium macrobrachii]GGX10743.1 hypothetical protein GCM10011282_16300 [Undibacterium macrobrachii]